MKREITVDGDYLATLYEREDYRNFLKAFTFREPAKKKAAFLAALRDNWTITHTAEAIGIGRRTIYDWRADDPQFKDAFEEADAAVTDDLRKLVRQIANGGEEKCSVPRMNMIFFELKRRDPTYRDKWVGEVGVSKDLVDLLTRIHEANKK